MSQSKVLVMLGNKTIPQTKLNTLRISGLLLVAFNSLVKHLNVVNIKQFPSNIWVHSLMPIPLMSIMINYSFLKATFYVWMILRTKMSFEFWYVFLKEYNKNCNNQIGSILSTEQNLILNRTATAWSTCQILHNQISISSVYAGHVVHT